MKETQLEILQKIAENTANTDTVPEAPVDGISYVRSNASWLPGETKDNIDAKNNEHDLKILDLEDTRIIWGGLYNPNSVYSINTLVRDGDWLGISATSTSQPIAPIEVGDAVSMYPENAILTTSTHEGVVQSGFEIEFTKSVEILEIQIYVPNISNTTHRVRSIDITDPDNPIATEIVNPVILENKWSTVALGKRIITPGTKYRVYIETISSSNTTNKTGSWQYGGDRVWGDSGTDGWVYRDKDKLLYISKYDLDGTDRTNDLSSFISGTIINLQDTYTPLNFREYITNGVGVDVGEYYEFSVSLNGNGDDIPDNTHTTLLIEIPTPQVTEYTEYSGALQSDSVANVVGYLTLSGIKQNTSSFFGVNIIAQEVSASDDWIRLAYYGGGSTSSRYTNGDGVDILNNVISVNDTVARTNVDETFDGSVTSSMIVIDSDSGSIDVSFKNETSLAAISVSTPVTSDSSRMDFKVQQDEVGGIQTAMWIEPDGSVFLNNVPASPLTDNIMRWDPTSKSIQYNSEVLVTEAPNDGTVYIRQNNDWVGVSGANAIIVPHTIIFGNGNILPTPTPDNEVFIVANHSSLSSPVGCEGDWANIPTTTTFQYNGTTTSGFRITASGLLLSDSTLNTDHSYVRLVEPSGVMTGSEKRYAAGRGTGPTTSDVGFTTIGYGEFSTGDQVTFEVAKDYIGDLTLHNVLFAFEPI